MTTPFWEPIMWFFSRAELPTMAWNGASFFVGALSSASGFTVVMWRNGRFRTVVSTRPL